MSYTKLLSEAITESGLSLREIAKTCTEKGAAVTHSYISQLKTGKQTSPSNEITYALAEVLNLDANLLMLENYLDNAPDALIKYLELQYFNRFDNSSDLLDEKSSVLRQSFLEQKSLSKFILEELKSDLVTKNPNSNYIVLDNDHFEPLIPKDSAVFTSEKNRLGNTFNIEKALNNTYANDLVVLSHSELWFTYIGYLKSEIFENPNSTDEDSVVRNLYLIPYNSGSSFKPILTITVEVNPNGPEYNMIDFEFDGFVSGFTIMNDLK